MILWRYSFTKRVVNVWNRLPNFVVYGNNTNTYKHRLDDFWKNQAIIYDLKLHHMESEVIVKCKVKCLL